MVATHAHHKQVRKYKPIPYINHPAEVAKIIQSHGFPDYMIAAAWLHDVVEDTDLTIADLQIHFDHRVTDLVVELTNTAKPEDGTRRVRMGINQARLAKISEKGQTIKLVDVYCNTRDICFSDHPRPSNLRPSGSTRSTSC
jgi:(p)ppGpp synthase/HD superfamily hydrolase